MRIKGIVLLSSLLLILSQFLNTALPAHSVEFGTDATGDPNAIDIYGSSGFLYSDRLVFTAAHVTMLQQIAYWEREDFVYGPGIGNRDGQKKYRVKKVLVNPFYIPRTESDRTRKNDFAILILQESIPMINQVIITSESDMAGFIKDKTSIYRVGYGLQNSSQRNPNQSGTLSPRKMTSYLISNEELKIYYKNFVLQIQTILNYGITNSEKNGSVCDGDSGAGFFAEKGNTRYYLGPVGGAQAGIPNCYEGAKFGDEGGMTSITGAHNYLALIKEAELLVAEDKQRKFAKAEELRIAAELKAKQEADAVAASELKAKQEAEEKAAADKAALDLKAKQEADAKAAVLAAAKKRTTIMCVKGKLTKKVTEVKPKCPAGYKVKK